MSVSYLEIAACFAASYPQLLPLLKVPVEEGLQVLPQRKQLQHRVQI